MTTRKESLIALRDKVRDGTIGDNGYDRFSAFPKRGGGVYADQNWHDAHEAYWKGSIDAALALCEAVLPGWWYLISASPSGAHVRIGPEKDEPFDDEQMVNAYTPARALLLAILEALIAEEE